MNKKFLILTILIILGIVAASGCTDTSTNSTSLEKKFSKEGISFNYPNNWDNVQKPDDMGSGSYQVQDLGYIGNETDNVHVFVQKVDLASVPGTTIEYVKNVSTEYFKGFANATVLNDTKTSVNGLDHYEVVLSATYPTTNGKSKHYLVIIGRDNEVGYSLDFFAPESNFDQQLSLFKSIEQTIKIQ